MDSLKERIISDNLSKWPDLPTVQNYHSAPIVNSAVLPPSVQQPQQLQPKRQFIPPFAQSITTQPTPNLPAPQQFQPSTKRQFLYPFPAFVTPVRAPLADARTMQPLSIPSISIVVPMQSPVPPVQLPKLKKQKKSQAKLTRGKRVRRWFAVCSILIVIAIVFLSQANGASGAWTADLMRTVLGPTITAQVESWYLGVSDTTHQLQYNLNGSHVDAPWTVSTVTPIPTAAVPAKAVRLAPMPLNRLTPLVAPALSGEGVWLPQELAAAPYSYLPLDAKSFIRPDPSHPYAIVTLLQFDTRFFRLHMMAGTTEPGGPRGIYGPGAIPTSDQKANFLLAAFNGGFKYSDGQYGLKVNNTIYVPPQPNAATIAVTKEGQLILGAWGIDPRLNSGNTDLGSWRQNASLLINNGTINPLTQDGAAWGGTILNSAYTWRSAIGITAHGTLIYAAGASLTAQTLGEALHAAGAVMAMQTDINPFWVRAFLYNRNTHGTLTISKLNPAMYGTGTEYLYGTERDFFYLTRFTPPSSPSQPTPKSHITASQ